MYPNHPGGHGHNGQNGHNGHNGLNNGQHPHWNPNQLPPSHATNGDYPPPSHHPAPQHPGHLGQHQQHPGHLPPQPTEPRPDAGLQHHQMPGYRLPPPGDWARGGQPPLDPYRGPPPPYGGPQQPAPRQRTAIACRYCRRRKIRCSGFEASEDGRCTNCLRFSQDCIFTPVSAQTQAFVPAHTRWHGVGQAPQLYGAYGQPLPPQTHTQEAYAPPRAQGYPLPSPTGPYSAPGPYASPLSSVYDDRGARDAYNSRKRPLAEPHTPTLPRPNPASVSSQFPLHRGPGSEYTYPDPTALTPAAVSPASSSASYHSAPQQPQPNPYYTTQPPRRSSPQSAYSYDPSRTSSSPHTQAAPSTPGGTPQQAFAPENALRPLPPRSDGRTPPPPTSQSSTRSGMRISDIVGDSGQGRSSTDSDMLNQLNRRPM